MCPDNAATNCVRCMCDLWMVDICLRLYLYSVFCQRSEAAPLDLACRSAVTDFAVDLRLRLAFALAMTLQWLYLLLQLVYRSTALL